MTYPNEIGPQHSKAAAGTDPRGILVFEYLPENLQNAEDSTQAADWERARKLTFERGIGVHHFMRRATPTERELLAHLGYTLPDKLLTAVICDNGVRLRFWPDLQRLVRPDADGEPVAVAMDGSGQEVVRVAPFVETETPEQEN